MKSKRTKVIPDASKPKPYCVQDILKTKDSMTRKLFLFQRTCAAINHDCLSYIGPDWPESFVREPMQIAG